jgi:hypothetical protein
MDCTLEEDDDEEEDLLQRKDSFGPLQLTHTTTTTWSNTSIPSLSASTSSDSDMAQYSRQRRRRSCCTKEKACQDHQYPLPSTPSQNTLSINVHTNVFDQCFDGSVVSMMGMEGIWNMAQLLAAPFGSSSSSKEWSTQQQQQNKMTPNNAPDECVEINEEDILCRDYDLERV